MADTTGSTSLIDVRDAVGPDLAELVAQYAFVPTDTPEFQRGPPLGVLGHWARCVVSPAYAEWWPLLELVRACEHGDQAGCEWLVRRYVPRALKFESADAFWAAATVGGYGPASRAGSTWPPRPPRVPRTTVGSRGRLVVECDAVRRACASGNLGLVQSLHSEFGFTTDYICCDHNQILRSATFGPASAHGRALSDTATEAVDWLMAEFRFTAADIAEIPGYISYFGLTGDAARLQRLFATLGPSVAGERDAEITIGCAIARGHFHVARLAAELTGVNATEAAAAQIRVGLEEFADRSEYPEAARYWLSGL